ncbi:hypothetical protein GCM10009541_53800 [Micromonospora gifhornensis]|uniref:Uncharacterized protein n=1 Tax=Micromonospora gifhornensis TaxID=84594 RepID=A0ABQ4IKQ3_9ACTN|nr:hypothetical protein [Micromonospora gifhornensis]GIJ18411.1 hypothetical protein Vgi01_50950 [Micromonospora gifhornensis]
MPNTSLTIVCLPQSTPTDQMAAKAATRVAATSLTSLGGAGHFITATRLRRGRLLQPWKGTAAGGPVRFLDLDAMRVAAHRAFWYRWRVWNWVVAGTRPAQPYWTFLDRHRADPGRYPIVKAQQHYLAQPRIAAMLTYNALPSRSTFLPTGHVEALQAGATSYAHYGWLCAVPGQRLIGLNGTHLVAAGDRYATHLAYLSQANERIAALHSRDILVALCTR